MSHRLVSNPLSRFAGVMAIMVFIITAILLSLDYCGITLNPIIGILSYTLFPALLFFYLLLIPIGMYREWRRRHKQAGEEPQHFPSFDFNVPHQRWSLYIFILGTSLVGLLVLAISYRAYDFTESTYFCSNICHKVMEPEVTSHDNSPHARVTCVQCHVGQGATWYVKSKLSGLYQVYATMFNKYPKPIETPVKNLRPSTDTCEECHWPSKFIGAKQVTITHYQEDERNTPRQLFMLLNVGGGISPTGIHWHVGQDEVYYVAKDNARQEIPWVKVKYKDGHEVVYNNGTETPKDAPRKMDCIDCHNRPTHIFKSPREALDQAIADGKINIKLPSIKKLGVDLLSQNFTSKEDAFQKISDGVLKFYKGKNVGDLEKTITSLKEIFETNNFPYMKSNWSAYPNNIGHMAWPGCFRCHDGEHKNNSGETIKKDCNICHIFLDEKLGGLMSNRAMLGKPFEHPVDVGGEDKRMSCNTCHAGR